VRSRFCTALVRRHVRPHADGVIARLPRSARALTVLVVLTVLSPVLAGAAAPSPPGEPGEPWSSTLALDHALVGRIWDVAGARFIDAPTFLARVGAARFVLLGEKHDNPDHHRLQAWVLRGLIAACRCQEVGLEIF
jgi:hypothetical protein